MQSAAQTMFAVFLTMMLAASHAHALTISPTFIDGEGIEWTETRKAVVLQAIADYEELILDDATVKVQFGFVRAGRQYLAMWWAAGKPDDGVDIKPWTPAIRHGILLNADLFDEIVWFDPTPDTDDDIPAGRIDALTVVRHEMGHMLGHTANLYYDDYCTETHADRWLAMMNENHVFDPEGLALAMNGENLGHTAQPGLMNGRVNGGSRYGPQATVERLALAHGYTIKQADENSDDQAANRREGKLPVGRQDLLPTELVLAFLCAAASAIMLFRIMKNRDRI